MSIACPHCYKSIGGDAPEGGFRVRLGIVLLDPATGAVHGPCPHCKGDVPLIDGGTLAKALRSPASPRIGVRVQRSQLLR